MCTILLQVIYSLLKSYLHIAGRSPAPEAQLTTPTSMEVLEEGGVVVNQDEGVVLSWGQGRGGSADDPLVISSNEDLEGEDSEVITAFSGWCFLCEFLYIVMFINKLLFL